MATALANAYIQVIPSTNKLQQGIDKALNGGSASKAGSKWGKGFASTVGKVIAAAGIGKIISDALSARGTFEQLSGGVEKIFDSMDTSQIYADANEAYKNLNMSANQYLETINDVGAAFSASMGDEKAYATAKTGLQAIADYASGTGKNVDVLKEKFAMITRSTSSYQSIADQFSGILPATSKDFLAQAQAAGILSDSYTALTQVPIDEYQEAVSLMLERGTEALNLTGNTAAEAEQTLTGSLSALKAVWQNFLTGTAGGADLARAIVPAIKNVARVLLEMLPELARGVWELIRELYPIVREKVSELISKIPEFAAELPGKIREIGDRVAEALPGILEKIKTTVTDALRSIIEIIPNEYLPLVAGILAALGTVAGYIAGASFVGKIINAGRQIIGGLKKLWAVLSANPIVLIVALVVGLIAAFITAYKTNDEFRAKVDAVWSAVKTTVVNAINAVKSFITVTVPETVNKVIEFFKALPEAALQLARDFINNIVATLTGLVLDIYNAGKEIITNLVDGAKSIFSNLVNLGQDVVDKIKEGISNAWSGLTSWFENLWNNLFNRKATISVDQNGATAQPYRTGLEYVPYDGFPAILHRGESVLTRAEAKEWRDGKNSGGVVINQTINTPVQTPVELAATTSAYFRQARWAMI